VTNNQQFTANNLNNSNDLKTLEKTNKTNETSGFANKFFTVLVEGATTDGRAVSREQITQMAANYNVATYPAFINIEHLKAYDPDSVFRNYGVVKELRATEITDGALAGKLALQAKIEPTKELIALNKAKQKLATSVEINPDFADFGGAYLVGLAVTDNPASLGTEILQFSTRAAVNPFAQRKTNLNNIFSAATCELSLLDDVPQTSNNLNNENNKNNIGGLNYLRNLLNALNSFSLSNLSDSSKELQLMSNDFNNHNKNNETNETNNINEQRTLINNFYSQFSGFLEQLSNQQQQQQSKLLELEQQLAKLSALPAADGRPVLTGINDFDNAGY